MPEPRDVAFRGGGFAPTRRRFAAPVAFAVLLLAWEGAGRAGDRRSVV